MDTAEKLTAVAENEKKVFDAGKQAEYDAFWDAYIPKDEEAGFYAGMFSGQGWNAETFSRIKYPTEKIAPLGVTGSERMFSYFNRNRNMSVSPNAPIDMTEFSDNSDFSQCTTANNVFQNARITNLTVNFENCSVFNNTFSNDNGGYIDNLTLKVTEKATSFAGTFAYAGSLKKLTFTEDSVIAASINFQHSPLTKESIKSVINALSSSTGKTATFKKTAKEAAFTADEWAELIATKSNWTFSLV